MYLKILGDIKLTHSSLMYNMFISITVVIILASSKTPATPLRRLRPQPP